MNFSTKIFIALLAITIISCSLVTLTVYSVFKKNIEIEFLNRYQVDGNIVANTFHQLEVSSDSANRNAVLILSEIEKHFGIPTDKELDVLSKKLGINGFYVVDKNGKFLRSSDIPVSLQHNSLFSYDPSYKRLIDGNLDIAITPIIPSYPYNVPAKLTMIPNHNKTLILESSTHLEYIEKILHQVIFSDKNIQSIGLYAPTGYELGSISSDGQFYQGRLKHKLGHMRFRYSPSPSAIIRRLCVVNIESLYRHPQKPFSNIISLCQTGVIEGRHIV